LGCREGQSIGEARQNAVPLVMKPIGRKIGLQEVALAACWLCLVFAFIALRAKAGHPFVNIDETIPIKISQAMSARGKLDPNWRFADLPEYLRYDQYNFYLYNVVAHAVITAGGWIGRAALASLRNANLLFQLAAAVFALDALRRIGIGRVGLAVAGALIAFAPGLVQDAGMARPESLLYLLSAVFVWTLTLPLSERWRMLLAGSVLGAGIAVKLTFASLAIMLPFVVALRGRPVRELAAGVACFAAGAAIGVIAAAPYAVLHFDAYLSGLAALAAQYASAHPPHSLPVYSAGSQALWICRYFIELYGLAPLAALAGPFLLKGPARNWALALVAAWFVLFVYFAAKPVFFERNLSHAVIPLLLAAALGIATFPGAWRAVAAALMLFPMAYWSVQIARLTPGPERMTQFEAAHGLTPTHRISFDEVYAGELPGKCETITLQDFNDPWSASYLARLAENDFQPIVLHRGRFRRLVTSTLHTYLDADVHYFRCPL
jgi:hypothetical protein